MRVLVTRPRADAETLVRDLRARGHDAVVEPLMEIRVRETADLDLEDVQAILFTSANGVRAFVARSERRDFRVLAVGETSAETARQAGFEDVESADGDAAALARLVCARLAPADGVLFHGAGSVVAGGLDEALGAAGFTVRRVPLYDAVPTRALSAQAWRALKERELDVVLFFSPRTADIFVNLIGSQDDVAVCRTLDAVCLSDAVARKAAALPWRDVRVAERPERMALLRTLDKVARREEVARRETEGTATKVTMDQDRNSNGETSPQDAPRDARDEGERGREAEDHGPAQSIIALFGGIRPMAHKLGVAVSTVQGWKNRGVIPEGRHAEVRAAAERHDIALDPDLLRVSGESARPAGERRGAGSEEGGRPARGAAPWGLSADQHAVAAETQAASAAESREDAAASSAAVGEGQGMQGASDDRARAGSKGTQASREGSGEERGDADGATVAPPPGPGAREDRRAGGWLPGMLVGAAIFAIAVGGTVVTRDAWLPLVDEDRAVGAAPAAGDVEALRADVSDLRDELTDRAAIEERLAEIEAQAAEDPEGLEVLSSEIEGMAERLAEAGARLEQVVGRTEAGAERIDQLSSRVERLETRLNDVAEGAAAANDVADMAERLRRTEEQIAELAVLGERVEAQEAIREAARSVAAQEVGRALAVANLRDALRFSEPFEGELEAARAAVEAESDAAAALDSLRPFAEQGIPTREQLIASFDAATREAMAVDAEYRADSDIVGGVLRRLGDIVTVRPVGEGAEGEGAGPVLARAEARLRAGDLRAAVETVQGLQGPALTEMEGWLEQAEARLMAEQVASGLAKRLAGGAPDTPANGG